MSIRTTTCLRQDSEGTYYTQVWYADYSNGQTKSVQACKLVLTSPKSIPTTRVSLLWQPGDDEKDEADYTLKRAMHAAINRRRLHHERHSKG